MGGHRANPFRGGGGGVWIFSGTTQFINGQITIMYLKIMSGMPRAFMKSIIICVLFMHGTQHSMEMRHKVLIYWP